MFSRWRKEGVVTKVTRDWLAAPPSGGWLVIRENLKRQALKRLRLAIDAADEWLHAEEHKFRNACAERRSVHAAPFAESTQGKDEFDVAKSRAREKAIRKARTPRLRYAHGQFVREA
jgi:biopolymer transport protein ExbB/TolQ